MCLQTRSGNVNIISAYAPTLDADSEVKDRFYDELSQVVSRIQSEEEMSLLGDFNARVGRDSDSWSGSIGPHGVGNVNENGQRLLEMCSFQNLSIMNTFFQTNLRYAVTWRHPTSGHRHQIDLIIARRESRPKFLHVRPRDLQSAKISQNSLVRIQDRPCLKDFFRYRRYAGISKH